MEKLYYTAKEVAEMLDVSVSHAYKVIRELTVNYLLKASMSEPAESAVSILTVKYMTYVIRQHKGKEQLYGSIQG